MNTSDKLPTQSNAEAVRRYKERQLKKGRVRIDLWVSASTAAKLYELQTSFDGTLGRTLERIVKARRSKRANFQESLWTAFDGIMSGTD